MQKGGLPRPFTYQTRRFCLVPFEVFCQESNGSRVAARSVLSWGCLTRWSCLLRELRSSGLRTLRVASSCAGLPSSSCCRSPTPNGARSSHLEW